jgi:HSP20 family protein
MDLIRNSPRHNLAGVRGFQNQANRLFDEFFTPTALSTRDPLEAATQSEEVANAWVPNVDVSEDDNNYHINVELPGMKKDDISVTVENGMLTVSGERQHESEQGGPNKDYHRVERFYGKFQRAFRLPDGVNEKDIDAQFTDGILHLMVPKAEESKPKQIDVKIK